MKKKRSGWGWKVFLIVLLVLQAAVPAPLSANGGTKWEFYVFGGNTSAEKNPDPIFTDDHSVKLKAEGGKIAGGEEGISFLATELPADENFVLSAKATVKNFNSNKEIGTPNQKSFGLMIKNEIGENGSSEKHTSDYVAAGALDTEMKGFFNHGGKQVKTAPFNNIASPAAGEVYDLSIRKSGNIYVLSVNGETHTVEAENLFGGNMYAGFFVARDAEIIFSDYQLRTSSMSVETLEVDASKMKAQYLVNEKLDSTNLHVKAHYTDGSSKALTGEEYIISGFDSSKPGTNTIAIHYEGVSENIELSILPRQAEKLEIVYPPAKTTYYPGDVFDYEGLQIKAIYNNGETEVLTKEQYSINTEKEFEQPGKKTVTIQSTETPGTKATLTVEVKDANLVGLEVSKQPEKTIYYLGDEVDLDGMVLLAVYDDGTKVRLHKNEYTAGELDTSSVGERNVVLSHKGKTTAIEVNVKEEELVGIQISNYPKTTYLVGERFSPEGLEVEKIYDNGDSEILSENEYEIDTSQFKTAHAGSGILTILPADAALKPITFKASVRKSKEYSWSSIRFGQSTSSKNNLSEEMENGSITLTALEGGGKVTGDHDGISYYYTELDAKEDNFELSAVIKVVEYAKNPHDGQESFGIMARDAIGKNDDSSVFGSNIAAIGGYSGGTKEENGIQLFVRTGVESPDGSGSKGIQNKMLAEKPETGSELKLTLKKTNSGFIGKMDGKEEMVFEPDILSVQDSKMYIGFFAARLATIEVSDIELKVSAAETDAPKIEPPKNAIEPKFDFSSIDKTSLTDYGVAVRSNVDGTVTIKQDEKIIASDHQIKAGMQVVIPAQLAANTDSKFTAVFWPDDTEKLTSYDKIIRNMTVQQKNYEGDIYVSPDGKKNGEGTVASPLDIDTAIAFIMPGQKIIVQDGVYKRSSKLEIKKTNDGTADAMKTMEAALGAKPVIDFGKKSEGAVLSGNYWHIKGIDFARSAGNTKGFTVGGSHNIIELCRFYENGDTGLQISRTDGSDDRTDWPANNLILNSTSFDNRDPSDNNADGFAAKLTAGEGNVFRGSIAHNNIDDGWDLYTKAGTGAIGAVLIEDCIAFDNGFLTDGTVGAGDKNGFKLGGEGIHVPHIIRGSLAFGNGAYGFTSNSNPGVIAENNISYDNAKGNLHFSTYGDIPTDFSIDGFISYQTKHLVKDVYPESLKGENNYFFDGSKAENATGIRLSDANFISLEPVPSFDRNENGEIVWGDFLRFVKR